MELLPICSMPRKPPRRVERAARARNVRPARRERVTLSEQDGVRFLHFGSPWVQGAMRIARPFALELEYQQQMMASALLLSQPQRIVQLGLGAGALTKFCWRHFPGASIVAVDISDAVIAAPRRCFKLPRDDARLTVPAADAFEYISVPARRSACDWLQVDLYDAKARGPVYDNVPFYRACRRALARPGVAVFNLFGRSFESSFAAIAAAFGDRALVLPGVDDGNRIVLALNGPTLDVPFAQLDREATRIQSELGLPARRWVTGLRVENCLDQSLRV